MKKLENLISSFDGYSINTELDLNQEFEVYNENVSSGFTCMMTDNHSLFSIDVTNAQDQTLIKLLEEILREYNLETNNLIDDITRCYKQKADEIQTDYERYWVIYRYDKDDDMVLVRYRAFVNA